MRHIQQLVLKNYRSLRNIDLSMSNLNILIGRNGAGKSNFLSFFQLMSDGANENLNRAISAMGGFPLAGYFGQQNPMIEWNITFVDESSDPKHIFYTGELNSSGNGYNIHLEEVSRDPYPKHLEPYKFLSVTDGRIRILNTPQQQTDEAGLENYQELAIAQIRNRTRYPTLAEIREMLSDWHVFRGLVTMRCKISVDNNYSTQ